MWHKIICPKSETSHEIQDHSQTNDAIEDQFQTSDAIQDQTSNSSQDRAAWLFVASTIILSSCFIILKNNHR